ncbi:MAG TPA: efflux RND transporter periplasmic adaptor subunit [Chthoniobacteraceae bacterium]|nr:efflux RND transporter periplasmic adaptor subunit [Chthoniobacteraceae bacterium]
MNTTLNHSGEQETQPRIDEVERVIPPMQPVQPAVSQGHMPARKGFAGKLIIGVVIALVVAGAILFQRSRAMAGLRASTLELAVPTVSVITPKAGPSQTEVVLPGNLTAYSETPIYARTNGYVKSWNTDIGAVVKAGDVMAELEAPDVDAQARQANAALAQARANLEIAKLNFGREEDLLKTKVISQQEFDQSRTNLEAMNAAVQAADANVQNLAVQQGFQKITAPFDGVVTKRNIDVGSLVSGNGNASISGQEMFHVARTDVLRVFIQVPQVYSAQVKLDTAAWLDLTESPGVKFQGKVAHISGALDAATRTLMTEVQVPNADGRLRPGEYANVHLVLPLANVARIIPINTLIFRGQHTQVGVVDASNVAHLRDVTLGRDFGTSLEVTAGLDAQDRVIVNPSDSLADGMTVHVQETPATDKSK